MPKQFVVVADEMKPGGYLKADGPFETFDEANGFARQVFNRNTHLHVFVYAETRNIFRKRWRVKKSALTSYCDCDE